MGVISKSGQTGKEWYYSEERDNMNQNMVFRKKVGGVVRR